MGSSLLKFKSMALMVAAAALILGIACSSSDDTASLSAADVEKIVSASLENTNAAIAAAQASAQEAVDTAAAAQAATEVVEAAAAGAAGAQAPPQPKRPVSKMTLAEMREKKKKGRV